jgi:hypothetical protein
VQSYPKPEVIYACKTGGVHIRIMNLTNNK